MVAQHREDEIRKSKDVHLLPRYAAGHFEGEVETYTPDQKMVGTTKIRWRHEPHTQYRCSQNLQLSGALNREIRMERTRHENHHFYEDGFYGNAVSFGRALFWRGNIKGETVRIIGRDFQLDGGDMAVAWEFWRADTLENVVHGVLKWTPDA